jgi:hypothetical protein
MPVDIPYPDYHTQTKALTESKKTNPDLKDAHCQVLQLKCCTNINKAIGIRAFLRK